MDIYVLHDGKEIGPLSTEKTWQLLNQGSVLADDLAWSPGMGKWEPLTQILPPAGDSPPAPAPERFETSPLEKSTAKQRALLAFLHVGFTSSTSKQEAALLISDALENPAYAVRLAQWPTERLKLHGDLFSAELQARRENRAHHYQILAQSEGAALFNGVTKAHAQNVITHLDLASPNWEANESTAAREHFFPALAEKFPDLVRPEAQSRFGPPDAQKTTQEISPLPARKTRVKNHRSGLPIAAIVRGLFFGALIVGIGWFVMKVLDGGKSPSVATTSNQAPSPPAASEPAATPPTPTEPIAAPAAPSTPPPATEPTPTPDAPLPMPASAPAPMAETPAPVTPPAAPPAPADSPAPAADAPATPTTLVLTKPFAATLTYGAVTLQPGTSLRLISQEGALLKVQYLNNVFLVPASVTNHGTAQSSPPGL